MEQVYQIQTIIAPSLGDAAGRLGYDRAFTLFMDLAGAHSDVLGTGVPAMLERGLFWLAVRSKARFYRRPFIGEPVVLRTWPEQPGKARVTRSYEIEQDGEIAVAAKTDWAVLRTDTHAIAPLAGVFPPELEYERPSACPEPFAALPRSFEPEQILGEYKVRSVDIDLGGHMNNAAYLPAALGFFSNEELAGLDIGCIDLAFRLPCLEGEVLELACRRGEEGLDLAFMKEGRPAFIARLSR